MLHCIAVLAMLNDTVPHELIDCFTADTTVTMVRSSNQICVQLMTANNPACAIFPPGVEIQIIL